MVGTSLLLCTSLFLCLGNAQSLVGPGSIPNPQLPVEPQTPGTAINPQLSVPSPVGVIAPTGPGAIDTTGPGAIDTTDPSGGSGGAAQPGLPAMTIPLRKTSSIHFVNVEDGLWDGFNFHYGFHEKLENINDMGCQSACMNDATCVVAVHCIALEDEIESPTTTPSVPAPGSDFNPSGFNVFNVKSRGQETVFYNCHIFEEVAVAIDYTSDDASTWGTNCKYIAINPKCRNMTAPTGWQAIHSPLLDEEHNYLQKYQCDNLRNLSISCDLKGVMTEHGACNPSVGPTPASPMPLLPPGLNAPLEGLFNPNFGGFTERPTCADEPCHIQADCQDTDASVECTCKEGWGGNGFDCSDEDECADETHNCGEKEECVNNVGTFTCVCAEGYSGTPCDDENECEAGSYSCEEKEECANTDGSYVCQCIEGHSGTPCEDVDECADETHNCGEKEECVNTVGSFTCVCAEGYSGTPCDDVDECEPSSNPCFVDSDCINTYGSFNCHCNTGFSGDYCEEENECETGSYSCGENQECEDTEGSYVCQCVEGYSGVPCEDINECELVNICPENQKCNNILGSYNCEQLTGESMCTGEYTYDPDINYCFKLYSSEEKENYIDAKMKCLSDGAKLASLSSELELTSVMTYLWAVLDYLGSSAVWLDGYQTYYGWYEINLWGDGQDVDDMNHWSPDDSKSGSQKCIDMGGYDLMFRDNPCITKQDFLCEKSTRTDCVAPFMTDPGNWNCFLILEPMMKSDAESSCPEGSRLALLKSQDQIDMVADYLMTNGIASGVWVGGKTYSGWWDSYGQWDDNVFMDERYVVQNSIWYSCWVLTLHEDKWLFDDKSCSQSLHAVCERPYPAYTAVGDS